MSKISPRVQIKPLQWLLMALVVVAGASFGKPVDARPIDALQGEEPSAATARQIEISLPVTGPVVVDVTAELRLVADLPPTPDRPVVVLNFVTSPSSSDGRGSDLGACVSLSRLLVSAEFNRLRTIAWIPDRGGKVSLRGHAVLVALAAGELAMADGASIGDAGIDETDVGPFERAAYEKIANQRRTLPVPMATALVDARQSLFRVVTQDKVVYVDGEALEQIEKTEKITETTTLSTATEPTVLSSEQLADYRLIRYRVDSIENLATRLGLSRNAFAVGVAGGEPWQPVEVTLPAYVDRAAASWLVRSLAVEINSSDVNMVILRIGDSAGDTEACLRLAEFLSGIDGDKIRTVAFVSGDARGAVGIVSLACDDLFFSSLGVIGRPKPALGDGDDENAEDETDFDEARQALVAIARRRSIDASLLMAMVDPNFGIIEYRHRDTGQVRLLGAAEHQALDNSDAWLAGKVVNVTSGIDADAAKSFELSRAAPNGFAGISAYYQLESDPRVLKSSKTDRWIEWFASVLASPGMSSLLLMGAIFLLMNELSAPGLGVAGFAGSLLLLAFFWSQFLDGNVQIFEVVLLFAGLIFVLLEVFVVPGFGVFGIGGLLMIVVAIILASQSFVIPFTKEELQQAPWSLLPVFGASVGFFGGLFVLRTVLPKMPYFNRMMLKPRKRDEGNGIAGPRDRDAVVNWAHLEGGTGVASTRLMPSGKAKIDGRVYDVISDGEVIDKGEAIVVIEVAGNRIVVERSQA